MRILAGQLVAWGTEAKTVHLTVLRDSELEQRGLEFPDGWQAAESDFTGLTVAVRLTDATYWKGRAADCYLCQKVEVRGIETTTRRQTNEEWRETGHDARIIGILGDTLAGLYRPHINAQNATI
jgi:hypothetical protein